MRKIGLLVAFVGALALGAGALVLPAGAGVGLPEDPATTIVIRKVVSGPATVGSTVEVECEGEGAILTFDATGAPDTTNTGAFSKVDGAWVFFTEIPDEAVECTFTETATGGAASTSFTCTYTAVEIEAPTSEGLEEPRAGCDASAGTGPGPVTVGYASVEDEVESQASIVTFTNTYAAPTVNTAPNFTG